MRFAIVLAAIVVLAAPAIAQENKKAPTPPATCEAFVTELGVVEKTVETTIEDTATGCKLTSFFANFGPLTRYRIGALTLEAPGFLDDYAAQQVPAQVDLTISGFLISPDAGSPLMNYIIEMQAEPMDIHLAYRWDRDARTVELADLSLAAGDFGSVRMAGRFSDTALDPNTMEDISRLPGKIDQLAVEIDNARFAATLFAPPLLGLLPFDEEPRPLVAGYIDAVNAAIAGLPSANVSDDSKAALTAFVSAFPKPTGNYTMELRADPGIAFADLDVADPAGLAAILARFTIAASASDPARPD